ncbi:MAG: hypothetical protein ACE5FP_08330, partial [Gemmatimonadota bacterium]
MNTSRKRTSPYVRFSVLFAGLVALGACAPKHIDEPPILVNGDRVDDGSTTVYETADRAEADRAQAAAERSDIEAEALADCVPEV